MSHLSPLQMAWLAVTAATIIFLIVAGISAMPKMNIPYTASIAVIFLAASGITAFGSLDPILAEAGLAPPAAVLGLAPAAAAADAGLPPPGAPGAPLDKAAGPVPFTLPPAPVPAAPLDNDASAGKVTFTFDDGPDVNTLAVIAELNELHVHGVFFMIGDKIAAHEPAVSAEIANGEVIGNHTWNHRSMTGKGTGTKPLTQALVRDELAQTSAAIVASGAPQPALWRPPYGAVDNADVATAQSLGLRVVLDSGTNIVDSNDWAGLKPAQIAARVDPVLQDQTIIAFHDGLSTAPNTIAALPLIVAYMNAHHLGETTTVRPDATGGIVNNNSSHQATETAASGPSAAAALATPVPASSAPVAAFTTPATAGGFTQAPVPAVVQPAVQPAVHDPVPAPVKSSKAPAPPATKAAPPPTTPAPAPTTPAPDPSTTTPAPAPTGTSTGSGTAA